MAQPLYSTPPSLSSIRPQIIPPSAGDIEEARMRRLLDAARLEQLRQAPVMEREQLRQALQFHMDQLGINNRQQDLAERALQETSRYHNTEAGLRQEEQGIQQRGQDMTYDTAMRQLAETSKYREGELGLKSRELDLNQRAHDTALTEHLASVVANSMDPQVRAALPDVLRRRGAPELADSIQAVHQQKTKETLATLLPTLKFAKDDNERALLLGKHAADPDVMTAVREMYPTIQPKTEQDKKTRAFDLYDALGLVTGGTAQLLRPRR